MTTSFDLRVMGLLLRQGRQLDALSRGLLALTLAWVVLAIVMQHVPALVVACALSLSVLAALLQTYYALRVAFDADLLATAAAQASPDEAAALLDRSLLSLGLVKPGNGGRDWTSRWHGARRLLRRQALCLAVQVLAFGVACVCTWQSRVFA